MISLGPYRSLRVPVRILVTPCIRKHKEAAPDIVARVQSKFV